MPVHTDREIKANRPDIVVKDKKERRCMLIDIAVPSERNTSAKFTEKLSKYKDLEIETNRMWDMKTETIPVVVGALGLIKKGLDKATCRIPGNNTNEIQKITWNSLHTKESTVTKITSSPIYSANRVSSDLPRKIGKRKETLLSGYHL